MKETPVISRASRDLKHWEPPAGAKQLQLFDFIVAPTWVRGPCIILSIKLRSLVLRVTQQKNLQLRICTQVCSQLPTSSSKISFLLKIVGVTWSCGFRMAKAWT